MKRERERGNSEMVACSVCVFDRRVVGIKSFDIEEEARKRKTGRLTVREHKRGMGAREMRHRGGGGYHPRPPWLF